LPLGKAALPLLLRLQLPAPSAETTMGMCVCSTRPQRCAMATVWMVVRQRPFLKSLTAGTVPWPSCWWCVRQRPGFCRIAPRLILQFSDQDQELTVACGGATAASSSVTCRRRCDIATILVRLPDFLSLFMAAKLHVQLILQLADQSYRVAM